MWFFDNAPIESDMNMLEIKVLNNVWVHFFIIPILYLLFIMIWKWFWVWGANVLNPFKMFIKNVLDISQVWSVVTCWFYKKQ